MADAKTKKRKLFRLTYNRDGSNAFPFMASNPIENAHYFARGFHDGADKLIEAYHHGTFPDYAVPPVVFLYRHAAELYLKSIIWNGDEILEFLKKPKSAAKGEDKNTHSLTKLLPHAEYVMGAFKLKWNEAEWGGYSDAAALIREIDEFDPTSFKFRYPIDKKGKASEHHEFGFNLFAFAEPVTKVLEGLWDLALDVESVREYHTLV
jgi:hypothetical protein